MSSSEIHLREVERESFLLAVSTDDRWVASSSASGVSVCHLGTTGNVSDQIIMDSNSR